ncbi:glutamine-dependent NAD(+) synthetase with GAT domain-containing protein [Fragilariopsis cylindrus CCMP1102]|uniref:Glutamine-dependent NAD(+) synthetase n=1 Tax=Fragilariopsis cylindrus CCMP1102 TaxID=635003 RepID=A0A1E7ELD1_9STRA|nr:glutamine-dependent NAD(+) synthetase with GAT domain-containing protein [Fragilariopsis cylindrus CCMP1102]|eukprot:OEU06739.1 glutamine-dependent NAD(+) synthetase with GAT domain-containing protein [Fragilariopsis cylindrus CCMP1102]
MSIPGNNIITVSTCSLNQWALDFDGNLERIKESCRLAKDRDQATYRLGPELEICGYGCEDHFLEIDTMNHSWQSLIELLIDSQTTRNLLCDFGMPLMGNDGCFYNCRILAMNHCILLIRPKTSMADNGNYRESRYFTAYTGTENSLFTIPIWVRDILSKNDLTKNHPHTVPFGISSSCIRTSDDILIGCESCEELWTPQSSHIALSLKGCDIIGNGSGSHHELRKLNKRIELIQSATSKSGGLYLYSNQCGCDGGRLYYDGSSLIVLNGQILKQSKQFSLCDVEVISATVDLDEIRSFRSSIPSFGIQVQQQKLSGSDNSNIVDVPDHVRLLSSTRNKKLNKSIDVHYHLPEEECCFGPACWLWDYLRRSGASGYLLPLSGGADSSAVATIVMAMCTLLYDEISANVNGLTVDTDSDDPDQQVLNDLRRICGYDVATKESKLLWVPESSQDIANHILHTVFMGTVNSSDITASRAKRLGNAIGSYHLTVPIDLMVNAVIKVFTLATSSFGNGGLIPQFLVNGGTLSEDLALQNIQARLRMVTAYLFAQLLPWVRNHSSNSSTAGISTGKCGTSFLLVLGSANVDEGLRGYMTKYDCSSADLNPIGSISKQDLKAMLVWASSNSKYELASNVLAEIANAPPTAELPAQAAEHSQLDEEEMGMSYEELGWFGKLRKLNRCGPVSMYKRLVDEWSHLHSPNEVAVKVKRFFYYYSINRHKMCTITPSYHAEGYSPDDNRYDLRPFLYNTKWTRQFYTIDLMVKQYENENEQEEKVIKQNQFLER